MDTWKTYFELVRRRRSIRHFQDRGVEEEKILGRVTARYQSDHLVGTRYILELAALARGGGER
ncbi:hypothetical protein GH141_01830 [bacterium]|nr:hypothetical protein [bacterium]